MAGHTHIVVQGECIRTIARRYGFADPDMIWSDPDNEELRMSRRSANVLRPGDLVAIPEKDAKTLKCETGKPHRFTMRRQPTRDLRVVFIDATGEAIASVPYVLKLEGEERRGKTDNDGAVDEKDIDPRIVTATLELPDLGIRRILNVGHLDPHHEETGWRQRLVNLGYSGDAQGLAAFSSDHDVPEDADHDARREKLWKIHRC